MSGTRVGIVGAGAIAQEHLAAYRSNPDVEIVGIVDHNEGRAIQMAQGLGVAAVSSLEELLELQVAAVSICTPTPTHVALSARALEAGVSVLCEKPIATNLADAEHLGAVEARAAGLLMIGHVSRFEPEHRLARDMIDSGAIGRVRMATQSITQSLPVWNPDGWFLRQAESGGVLLDVGIHALDYLSWIIGSPPTAVQSVGSVNSDGLVEYSLVTITYDCGAIARVEASWAHPPEAGLGVATEIIGSSGRIAWDYEGISTGKIWHLDDGVESISPLGGRGFAAEVGAFVDAVRAGGPSPVSVGDALTALRIALAAQESMVTGATVVLGEIT